MKIRGRMLPSNAKCSYNRAQVRLRWWSEAPRRFPPRQLWIPRRPESLKGEVREARVCWFANRPLDLPNLRGGTQTSPHIRDQRQGHRRSHSLPDRPSHLPRGNRPTSGDNGPTVDPGKASLMGPHFPARPHLTNQHWHHQALRTAQIRGLPARSGARPVRLACPVSVGSAH